MDEIRSSTVVTAYVVDQFGKNPKHRHNLVVKLGNDTVFALGITSSIDFDNPTQYQIELPFKPDGSCKTGLTKRSVVCCNMDQRDSSGRMPEKWIRAWETNAAYHRATERVHRLP